MRIKIPAISSWKRSVWLNTSFSLQEQDKSFFCFDSLDLFDSPLFRLWFWQAATKHKCTSVICYCHKLTVKVWSGFVDLLLANAEPGMPNLLALFPIGLEIFCVATCLFCFYWHFVFFFSPLGMCAAVVDPTTACSGEEKQTWTWKTFLPRLLKVKSTKLVTYTFPFTSSRHVEYGGTEQWRRPVSSVGANNAKVRGSIIVRAKVLNIALINRSRWVFTSRINSFITQHDFIWVLACHDPTLQTLKT